MNEHNKTESYREQTVARGEGIGRRERERKRNRDCMLKNTSNHSVYLCLYLIMF